MLSDILKTQLAAETYLPPYNYHVHPSIVSLDDGRVMFIVRMSGSAFEAVSDNLLENQYDSLNDFLMSQAKPVGGRLATWVYIDHYRTQFRTNYKFEYEWMQRFNDTYMQKFSNRDMYETMFYMAFLLKPNAIDSLDECIRELEEIQIAVLQSLAPYECELLEKYKYNGLDFSEVYEFIAYLYNGFWERVPITSLPLREAVPSSLHHHGYRLIETRYPDGGNCFKAFFDLKDFPDPVGRGMLNPMLELSFPFIICFSFTFISPPDAIKMIGSTLNKMESAGDQASEQHRALGVARGSIQAGDIYFGELHGAMVVFGNTEKQAEDRGATARTTLSTSCATQFLPANLSAPETFYSMFPGNIKRRPRPMPKTTRNLLGMFSMNTYSSGKQYGNPVGDGSAVMPLQTKVNGVYHFNCHYSLPDMDSFGEKRAGHVAMFGATGAGKTTAQTSILSFMTRWGLKIFGIDKDGSMRGFIEAQGGTYFTLRSGEPTGLNPFQLPDTPANRQFLYDLVEACGRKKGVNATAEDLRDIKRAVDNVFELPFEHRRFGVLLHSIPDRGEDCLARRLAEWCYGEIDGRYAYALDNPTNAFDWSSFHRIGFDVTDFLIVDHPATEPILSYLLHIKRLIQQDGSLMVTVVEEFWLPIQYPTTCDQILDILKTGRRRGEFAMLVTQSPEDAINSPIIPAILQQTPTKIFLPNPDAEYETKNGGGYVRFGLTPKEFKKLKSLGLQSRQFLVKQGTQSAIVKLDLNGMGDDIAVLAMDAEDHKYLVEAKKRVGNNPDKWVPEYKRIRKDAREKTPQTQSNGEQYEEDAIMV